MPNTNSLLTIGHIFSGYASNYYAYALGFVQNYDCFERFKKEGLMNTKLGMEYRKTILAPGGTRPSEESINIFLGRKWNNNAYLNANGFMM